MTKTLLSSLLIMIGFSTNSFGQDLSAHRWENRLLIILTTSKDNPIYKQQVMEFKGSPTKMKERKLLVYQGTPKAYWKGLDEPADWNEGDALFKKYKTTNSDLEVILIGLDGGIKLRETTLVTAEKLFTLIDSMPMRSSELRKQGEK